MKWLFWGSVGIITYTYAGYAGWLWLRRRWRYRPVKTSTFTPSLTIVMVVRNEAEGLERKLRNLIELNYPEELRRIIVVSDGSTDGTNDILSLWSKRSEIQVILHPDSQGKAAGLNDAFEAATGEVVVFADARQKIEPNAIRLLAENFADPEVGCASGELMLGEPESGENVQGMGLYWRIEKIVRELESASGSVVGATGALYAVRRSLLVSIPAETVLDDVYIPMNVVRQGARVIFDPRAQAWDVPSLGASREFARKVRTLSGNYQLVQLAPWLLSSSNPLRFEFISHKLLRLAIPFVLTATFVTSVFLKQPIYKIALVLQVGFYAMSLLALGQFSRGPLARISDAAFTFVVLNTAAAVAFANFVTGKKTVWIR